jgi:hypothetical protein
VARRHLRLGRCRVNGAGRQRGPRAARRGATPPPPPSNLALPPAFRARRRTHRPSAPARCAAAGGWQRCRRHARLC